MTLSTSGETGEPHAAPVYFAAASKPSLHFYFFSEADSQHARDIAAHPQAAAALYPEASDWQEIRGLQVRGRVEPVRPGETWETAWELYRTKFPFVKDLKHIIERNQLYVLIPRWMRLLDNRQGFGFKKEWELS